MFYIFTTAAILIGVLLDLIFGDPLWLPHPVRWMGSLIAELEAFFMRRIADNPREKRRAGMQLWLIMVLSTLVVSGTLMFISWKISRHVYLVIASVICYYCMAAKSLRKESMGVKERLDDDDIYTARNRLSRIVGRDTDKLDEEHVIRAAVETVAENTNDGCVAPLFYMMIFGPVGALVYKAINTMDSMLGYKNDRYKDFGYFAARADDFAGFIPARISAVLMIISAYILRLDGASAVRIFRRDRLKSESPNSGQTESVAAGALGIELLGDAYYGGELHKRPVIGDFQNYPESDDIEKTGDMMYLTVIFTVVLVMVWRVLIAWLMGLIG